MSLLRPIPPGSFDIKARIIQNMQSAQVNDQIFDATQKLFEKALDKENIILAHSEKQRLLRKVMKSVLTDMLKKLDNDQ